MILRSKDFKRGQSSQGEPDRGDQGAGSNEIARVATADGQSVGNAEPSPGRAAGDGEAEGASGNALEAHAAPIPDAVETALATALERAALAGQWSVVEALARELEARRRARN